MKKLPIILMLALAASILQTAKAQVTTKYGDNVSTLDGIMKAYYDVVEVKKGGKINYERDSLIHWPNVNVGSEGIGKNGKSVFHYMSLKEYHRRSDASLEKDGFYEKEIFRKVENFGGFYHVWSTSELRNEPGGPMIERSVNSVELYFDGTRFWIMGWFSASESKQNPIPKKYLSN
jgi:hypothetical protein